MTLIRRALALAAYASFIPFSLTGFGGACEVHHEASMNMGVPSIDSPDMVNGQMAPAATISCMDDGECVSPPCDERMSLGDCQTMPGCVAGASVVPATSRAGAVGPATTEASAALVATLLSRAIAPEVPPPRA